MATLSEFIGPVQPLQNVDPLYAEAAKLSEITGHDPRFYLSNNGVLNKILPIVWAAHHHGRKDLPEKQAAQKAFMAKLKHGTENLLCRSNAYHMQFPASEHPNSTILGRNSIATLTSIASSLDSSEFPKLFEHNRDNVGGAHTTLCHTYAQEISSIHANMNMNTPNSEIPKGGIEAANARFQATQVVGKLGGYSGLNFPSKADSQSSANFVTRHLFSMTDFGLSTLQRLDMIIPPTHEIFYQTDAMARAVCGIYALVNAFTSAHATEKNPEGGEDGVVGMSLESIGIHAHAETDVIQCRFVNVALRLGVGGYKTSQAMLMEMIHSCFEDGPVVV